MQPALRHLSGAVYAFSGTILTVRPWLGVITTSAGTVLIDSGNGPLQARDLQATLATIAAPPVSHILLTHHHWDHVFGNHYFPQARVIAHEGTQYHLRVMEQEPWGVDYVRTKGSGSKQSRIIAETMIRAVPDFATFKAIPAHDTFTDRYELILGDHQFLIDHIGGEHATDHVVIQVFPENVLFVGDAPYGSPSRGDWDRQAVLTQMEDFLARGAAWYVEGHRAPLPHDRYQERVADFRARIAIQE